MDRPLQKKKWTPARIIIILAGVAFAYLIIHLVFIRDTRSRMYVDPGQLSIVSVLRDKFQEFIPVDGIVYPKSTVYIDAVQGGVVEEVFVEDGALLKKGDPILKLSNPNMELSFMETETRIVEAINNLQNSKIDLERNKIFRQQEIVDLQYRIDQTTKDFKRTEVLYSDSLISTKEYEDAQRNYDFTLKQLLISLRLQRLDSLASVDQEKQIQQSIRRMYDNMGLLHKNLELLYIKAPVDGKLSSFNVEIGQTKSQGEHLGQIDLQDGFKLQANIDERYVSRVYTGQEAEMDFSGKTYQLAVHKIYTGVSGGSFPVDLLFTGEYPENIKRGQTIQLRLEFSRPTEAFIIKRGGFFQTTGGNWIYVVDPSGDFAIRRPIRLGSQNTYFYEVLEGLKEGEKVIVSSYEPFGDKEKLVFK
ncbi:MAG TPA: HlyD family efflux transporter periplasmic adaptor subunit [Bacteroidales bacterium]|nr:HlyD family efflux transporter periplasmic adaptor subunit [Bacteroidales bacterium]HNS47307.1 HlyD family efflux transporter periplasmic adaptor subunit [Bacteroidales bacterium]